MVKQVLQDSRKVLLQVLQPQELHLLLLHQKLRLEEVEQLAAQNSVQNAVQNMDRPLQSSVVNAEQKGCEKQSEKFIFV